MRLQELFLTETTEEDRALISLSSAIYNQIQQYADEEIEDDDWEDEDPDFDHIPKDVKSIIVGKIGDLFDTPIEGLNKITLELLSSPDLRRRLEQGSSDVEITKGPKGEILGVWFGENSTIALNKEYLGTNSLKSAITHELRHALDDFKSDGEANKVGGRYSIPKNKSYRTVTNDPHMGNLRYLAEPAEINARFVQVLHSLVPAIARAAKLAPDQVQPSIMSAFKRSMSLYNIMHLFPEKEKSRDYKRLVKRGMDFIQKELAHIQKTQK